MYALKKNHLFLSKNKITYPTKNNNNKYTYFFLYNFSLMITIIKKIKKKIKYFLLYMYKNTLTDKALMILLYQ